MIIHHAGGLHVRVANGAAKEFKAALFHVFTYYVRFGRGGLRAIFKMVFDRLSIRHKTVQVIIKRAELFLHIYKQLRVADGGVYF